MSSNEEDRNYGERRAHSSKKQKIILPRACDNCRKKKIRCDGPQMQGNKCSRCVQHALECTYMENSQRRAPAKGYVKGLETQIQEMDKLLRRLCPDESTYKALMNTLGKNDLSLAHDSVPSGSRLSTGSSSNTSLKIPNVLDALTTVIRDMPEEPQPSVYLDDEDDVTALFLTDTLNELSLEPQEYRFFGKSSGALLIQKAVEAKSQYVGAATWKPVMKNFRLEFWNLRDWEKEHTLSETPTFDFPEPDLSKELISHYFKQFNLYLPLLHRPTFEKALEKKEHLVDSSFAAVYLLVCALGARYSNDPRVFLPRDPLPHSAGWRWFEQANGFKRSLLVPPKLYDLQYYPLAVQFVSGSSMPQSCWTLIGVGLRLGQEVGIHRRKVSQKITAQDELWRRAFWILIILDRMFSSSLGRPCGIHDEDFDLDLPIDLDDEYWEEDHPTQHPNVPEAKPSKISAFIFYIKLARILSFTLRTVYALNKSKILKGFTGPLWEQALVAELDSALNSWVYSIPPHLRWDPNRVDEDFFNQSVFLHSTYYLVQIMIHRPFIPTPTKPSPLNFPSLAICTNAARSCSQLINLQRKRTMSVPPLSHMAVYSAGIVLLLGLWSGKLSGLSSEIVKRDMENVYMCMKALRVAEDRWRAAGRLWDILYELAHAGDLPLPELTALRSNKRARGADVPNTIDGSLDECNDQATCGARIISGGRRAYKENPASQSLPGSLPEVSTMPPNLQHTSPTGSTPTGDDDAPPTPMSECSTSPPFQITDAPFQLPLYTNDLGRLPLHGPLNFTPSNDYHHHSGPVSPRFPWFSAALGDTEIAQQDKPHPSSSNWASQSNILTELFSTTDGFGTMPPSLETPSIPGSSGTPLEFQMPSTLPGMNNQDQMPLGALENFSQLQQPTQDGFPQQSTSATAAVDGMQGTDFEFMDDNVMDMWLNAPNLLMDDWGAYLSNLTEMPNPLQSNAQPGEPGQDQQTF